MRLRVLFFASIREKLRQGEAMYSLPDGATVSELIDHLCREHPSLADVRRSLSVAVNHEYVEPTHELADNDEVALIPPVSGGIDVSNRPARH